MAVEASAIAACFAGVTAVANVMSAFQAYREGNAPETGVPKTANSVRGNDAVESYLDRHLICGTLKSPQVEPDEQDRYCTQLLYSLPKTSRGKLSRRACFKKALRYSIKRSTSFFRDESADHPSPEALGGKLNMVEGVQQAPDTNRDDLTCTGISTGKKPMFNIKDAHDHWATVKNGNACNPAKSNHVETIVVVNWNSQILTVFMKVERGKYFRNYQVREANLEYFAEEFQQHVAFTGVIRGGRLVGASADIALADDDPSCGLRSENGWTLLGLGGPGAQSTSLGKCVFLGMPRAALFGLVECLYKNPTLLNVDTLYGGSAPGTEFVHADTPDRVPLDYQDDNIFSVFALNIEETLPYAQHRVLVG